MKPFNLCYFKRHFSLSLQLKEQLITCPIFYVNSKPHLGHLYTTVMADTLKRFYDLKQMKTKLSVGTDEHGLKIEQAAKTAKAKDPKEFCDAVSKEFYNLFKAANIDYTRFIRTTDSDHKLAVKHFWERLMKRGWIYKGHHEGWYSVSDETFVPDSQIDTIERNGIEVKV
jgi:methionyl-tRNA synthetase